MNQIMLDTLSCWLQTVAAQQNIEVRLRQTNTQGLAVDGVKPALSETRGTVQPTNDWMQRLQRCSIDAAALNSYLLISFR